MAADGRLVRLIFEGDARSVTRAYNEIALGSDRTAAVVARNAEKQRAANAKTIASGKTAARSVGRTFRTAALGVAVLGVVGIKQAVDFSGAMTQIQTGAGASAAEVTKMSAAIEKFAASGKAYSTATTLAKGIYSIESVGLRGARAMRALTLADEEAAMSHTDLNTVTSVFASAIVSTGAKVSQYKGLMAELNAAVGVGKLRFSDLAAALSHGILPQFKLVGLGTKDAVAAISTLTRLNYAGSAIGTLLPSSLHYLSAPGTAATKALAGIGIKQYQLASDLRKPNGLLTALRDLQSHLHGTPLQQATTMQEIIPGSRGKILTALIQHLSDYSSILDKITTKTATYDQQTKAFDKTPGAKFKAGWVSIQAAVQSFGKSLLPIVQQYLPKLIGLVKTVSGIFKSLGSTGRTALFDLVVGTVVLSGLVKLVGLLKEIRLMYIGITAWATRATGAEEAAAAAGVGAGPRVGGVKAIQSGEKASKFSRFARGAGRAAGALSVAYGVSQLYNAVAGALGASKETSAHYRSAATGRQVVNPRVAPFLPHHFASGGLVGGLGSDTIPAWLSAGEGVLNRTAMANLTPGGLNAMNAGMVPGPGHFSIEQAPINLFLDGRLIARSVTAAVLRKAARGPSSLTGGSLVTGAPVGSTFGLSGGGGGGQPGSG